MISQRSPLAAELLAAATASPAAVLLLHLNLRDIRISTRLKGKGDLYGTRGVTVRGHVHQVIDTVHILFDNLCHRVLHCFRISTG